MINVQAMNNIDAEGADQEEVKPAALLKDAEDNFAWVFGTSKDEEQVVDADEEVVDAEEQLVDANEQVVDADEQEGDEVNGIVE